MSSSELPMPPEGIRCSETPGEHLQSDPEPVTMQSPISAGAIPVACEECQALNYEVHESVLPEESAAGAHVDLRCGQCGHLRERVELEEPVGADQISQHIRAKGFAAELLRYPEHGALIRVPAGGLPECRVDAGWHDGLREELESEGRL